MNFSTDRLAQNYQSVLNRIERAAVAAGREPAEICLVAVTKYVDADVIKGLWDLGCREFGESRPQALWQKAEELEPLELHWHLIGHLQTNKVRKTLPCVSLIHSGDSLKVIQAIEKESERVDRVTEILCEVNISGDDSKHGMRPERVGEHLAQIADWGHVRVKGLMAMASLGGGAAQARQDFEKMQRLRDDLAREVPDSISLAELSMGMSGDFEQAIECGATLVRVGSSLFEEV